MHQIMTGLAWSVFWLIRLIPVRLAGAIGAGLGRIAFYVDARHRSISIRNLTRIYPQKTRPWRRRIARESLAELGRNIMEIPHIYLRSKSFLLSRVSLQGHAEFSENLKKTGLFGVAMHHGNWELGSLMVSALGHPCDLMYRPLRQPWQEDFLRQRRQRFGARMRSRRDGLRWSSRIKSANACVGVLIDQHMGEGVPVPFMGHLANTTLLPAKLALRHDIPMYAITLQRIGRGFCFRMGFNEISQTEISGADESAARKLMQQAHHAFEPMIDQRPEMWLWSHQRWKLLEEHNKDITEVVYGTP
ncbi:MAG: lauroyl acyltransferase [Mariprofundaceae bacterium]